MEARPITRRRVLVTGSTGLLGTCIVNRLLESGYSEVHLAIRPRSIETQTSRIGSWRERAMTSNSDVIVHTLDLGDAFTLDYAHELDHVYHVAGLYDMAAEENELMRHNVDATRNLVDALVKGCFKGTLHHVSTIAVAGDYDGRFKEDMFDEGQSFSHPYPKSKYLAEAIVRDVDTFRIRVYRPGAIIGETKTGFAERFDGMYYMLGPIRTLLSKWPRFMPLPAFKGIARMQIVPVDWAANSIVSIAESTFIGKEDTFHITDGHNYDVGDLVKLFAQQISPGRSVWSIDTRWLSPMIDAYVKPFVNLQIVTDFKESYTRLFDIPRAAFDGFNTRLKIDTANTRRVMAKLGGMPPKVHDYADKLYRYFDSQQEALTTLRTQKYLVGKKALITGASSGIGEQLALMAAEAGAHVIITARREAELMRVADSIRAADGKVTVYACDIGDEESCNGLIRYIKSFHPDTALLFNNAGVSVRKSIRQRLDRFDDIERTNNINYLAPARLILGMIPLFQASGSGHIVNSLSAVASYPMPRFAAYSASKSALAAFCQSLSAELMEENIYFTDAYLPLVRTAMIHGSEVYKDNTSSYILTPESAAQTMLDGIATRPREVNFGFASCRELQALRATMPDTRTLYLNSLYRVYSDKPETRVRYETERSLLAPVFPGDPL